MCMIYVFAYRTEQCLTGTNVQYSDSPWITVIVICSQFLLTYLFNSQRICDYTAYCYVRTISYNYCASTVFSAIVVRIDIVREKSNFDFITSLFIVSHCEQFITGTYWMLNNTRHVCLPTFFSIRSIGRHDHWSVATCIFCIYLKNIKYFIFTNHTLHNRWNMN